jgi:hypothetical protein
MSRNRLTNRTASDMKAKPGTPVEDKGSGVDNDVFNMNDTGHEKNDPSVSEYAKGDPSAWGEDVNKDNPAKDDQKREETGHAPLIDKHAAQEAVASALRLEEKAVKAIIASQRMLPYATDELIERQASILMHLPEEGLNATLANQEVLARMVAKAAAESTEDAEDDKEDKEEKAAAEECAKEPEEKEEKAAAVEEKKEDEKELSPKEKLANLKKQAEELEKQIDDEEKPAADDKDEEEKAEKPVEASDSNILDQIFSGVMPSPIKKGASKLSGIVKKEASSSGSNDLSSLWSTAPDVSSLF